MKSVGYEVFRGTDHISLLSTVGLDECSTLEKIPLGFIIKIVYLTEIPTKEPNDADV